MRRAIPHIMVLIIVVFAISAAAEEIRFTLVSDQDPGLQAYIEARQLLLSHRFAEAAEKFESFLAAFPGSHRADDALFYLGYCREYLGQKQQAFSRYKQLLDNYRSSNAYRRAMERAMDLARVLRRTKGDEYDNFLVKQMQTGSGNYYAVQSAISLAEVGDWSGKFVLIKGLEGGDQFQQIRIASLLANRRQDNEVRQALALALETSRNDIVRMTAASVLAGMSGNEEVRRALSHALTTDRNSLVKMTAATALTPHLEDVDVAKAFVSVIRTESDPLVLISVVDGLSLRGAGQQVTDEIVSRIESEPNPTIKYALMNGIRGRTKIRIEEENVLVESLIENPAPTIRLHALNLIAAKVHDPKVKKLVVKTLKSDPSVSVRIAAMNILSDSVQDEDVRKAILEVTLENKSEIRLTSSAIRVLSTHVEIPEIRVELLGMLKMPELPPTLVTAELVAGLTPVVELPEVQDVFIEILEETPDLRIKMFIVRRLDRILGEERLKRLEELYKREKDVVLANYYLQLIAKTDPERAKALSLAREQTR
ncbi:MAG TPA: HEAT repeat domain-containing protein [Acidobacteriota bacterium]|nr:HEAT repeat domain-containing protein [Acidobacteriota bacterium]